MGVLSTYCFGLAFDVYLVELMCSMSVGCGVWLANKQPVSSLGADHTKCRNHPNAVPKKHVCSPKMTWEQPQNLPKSSPCVAQNQPMSSPVSAQEQPMISPRIAQNRM